MNPSNIEMRIGDLRQNPMLMLMDIYKENRGYKQGWAMVSTMHTLQVIQGPNQISRLELEQSNRQFRRSMYHRKRKKENKRSLIDPTSIYRC